MSTALAFDDRSALQPDWPTSSKQRTQESARANRDGRRLEVQLDAIDEWQPLRGAAPTARCETAFFCTFSSYSGVYTYMHTHVTCTCHMYNMCMYMHMHMYNMHMYNM